LIESTFGDTRAWWIQPYRFYRNLAIEVGSISALALGLTRGALKSVALNTLSQRTLIRPYFSDRKVMED